MQQIIKELAGAYPLGDWKLADNLSTGFVNENYKIDTASSQFFLRIYRQQPLESIESEMDLYCALSEIEFPTAYPIAKSDGSNGIHGNDTLAPDVAPTEIDCRQRHAPRETAGLGRQI